MMPRGWLRVTRPSTGPAIQPGSLCRKTPHIASASQQQVELRACGRTSRQKPEMIMPTASSTSMPRCKQRRRCNDARSMVCRSKRQMIKARSVPRYKKQKNGVLLSRWEDASLRQARLITHGQVKNDRPSCPASKQLNAA